MTIVKAILELEDNETREVDILTHLTGGEVTELLAHDDCALADLISDETGYCVQEIIGWKEPDYSI